MAGTQGGHFIDERTFQAHSGTAWSGGFLRNFSLGCCQAFVMVLLVINLFAKHMLVSKSLVFVYSCLTVLLVQERTARGVA